MIPDPIRCLREVARVVRPGGRVAVFDKFAAAAPSWRLRALNLVTNTLFTDVTRRLEHLLAQSGAPLQIEHDEPALLKGVFRHVVLRRRG